MKMSSTSCCSWLSIGDSFVGVRLWPCDLVPGQKHRGTKNLSMALNTHSWQGQKSSLELHNAKNSKLTYSRQEPLSLLQTGKKTMMRIPNETFARRFLLQEENQGLLRISAGPPYPWCLQCLPLASSLSPNVLHLCAFEITSCTAEVQLIPECWGKGHLCRGVKLSNQRRSSSRGTVAVFSWNQEESLYLSWQLSRIWGSFSFIELTKWLYLCSFTYEKVNVSEQEAERTQYW